MSTIPRTRTTIETITDEQIRKLSSKARKDGNSMLVSDCRLALEGSRSHRRHCARAIEQDEIQNDNVYAVDVSVELADGSHAWRFVEVRADSRRDAKGEALKLVQATEEGLRAICPMTTKKV